MGPLGSMASSPGTEKRELGNHSDWREMELHCGFDLHFSDNE